MLRHQVLSPSISDVRLRAEFADRNQIINACSWHDEACRWRSRPQLQQRK
jgi:hypothetical protein